MLCAVYSCVKNVERKDVEGELFWSYVELCVVSA